MRRPARPFPIAIFTLLLLAGTAVSSHAEDEAGYLGVFLGGAEPSGDGEDATAPRGVRVLGIVEDGPASGAGLRARDRILAVEGSPVTTSGEMISRIKGLAPGSWVSVTVERDGDPFEVRIRLTERPAASSRLRMVRGWIGADAIDLPPALREHFGAPEDAGVMISGISEGSPAESAGLYLGDVVYEIDGQPVGSSGEFRRLVVGGGVGNVAEIVLARDGAEIVLEATIDRTPPDEPRADTERER